jgi:hypothetical protein
MEPFSMTKGTEVKVFSLKDNDATIAIATSDTARPDMAALMQYEQCESDDESAAVIQKFVFDLQRQGWELTD